MKVARITSFHDEHRFLSNFWSATIVLPDDNEYYRTVEHAYQASKFPPGSPQRIQCRDIYSASKVKEIGRGVRHPEPLKIMRTLLDQKFAPGTILAIFLLQTGDAELIEGNYWGDVFWGQCPLGVGENMLGRLLMKVRDQLRGRLL